MKDASVSIKKWKSWLEIIGQEIGSLSTARTIYEQMWSIIDKNDDLKKMHGLFFNWLTKNYSTRIAVEIRRLTDRAGDVISIRRLLDDIAHNPEEISREWFISQYKDDYLKARDLPNSDFNRYTDTSQDNYVSVTKIQGDIVILEKEANEIRVFVNKYLAHHDEKQEKYDIPTFENAYKVIKHIDDLYCKYFLLLNQGGMTSREPVVQYDWWKVFNIPWIKPDNATH